MEPRPLESAELVCLGPEATAKWCLNCSLTDPGVGWVVPVSYPGLSCSLWGNLQQSALWTLL